MSIKVLINGKGLSLLESDLRLIDLAVKEYGFVAGEFDRTDEKAVRIEASAAEDVIDYEVGKDGSGTFVCWTEDMEEPDFVIDYNDDGPDDSYLMRSPEYMPVNRIDTVSGFRLGDPLPFGEHDPDGTGGR